MILATYVGSGLLLLGTAWLFNQGVLTAVTLTACWSAHRPQFGRQADQAPSGRLTTTLCSSMLPDPVRAALTGRFTSSAFGR
jgi:hypothetical protein